MINCTPVSCGQWRMGVEAPVRHVQVIPSFSTWQSILSLKNSKLGEDATAFFSPLRLGEQRIPERAPVKSGLKGHPEGTRSVSRALFTGIASEEL